MLLATDTIPGGRGGGGERGGGKIKLDNIACQRASSSMHASALEHAMLHWLLPTSLHYPSTSCQNRCVCLPEFEMRARKNLF
jgi:hypothetical protein